MVIVLTFCEIPYLDEKIWEKIAKVYGIKTYKYRALVRNAGLKKMYKDATVRKIISRGFHYVSHLSLQNMSSMIELCICLR